MNMLRINWKEKEKQNLVFPFYSKLHIKKVIIMKLKVLFLFVIAAFVKTNTYSQCTREQVINDYNNIYLQTTVSDAQLAWTGTTSNCTAGTISEMAQTNTLARINYYRKLAGLQPALAFNPINNTKCQQAALMMYANNSINHFPPTNWLCYTIEGAQAASSSNLAFGFHSSAAVDFYMNDIGVSSAGHRRWILNSIPPDFGHGATPLSDVLWITGTVGTVITTTPITFPSSGYFPAPLVPSSRYWSFGLYNSNFNSATVQMFDQSGSAVTINLLPVQTGFGDNTIVWEAPNIVTNSPFDVKYTVKVNNVLVAGELKNYSYDVIICQPVHPPQCPSGQTWSEADCSCAAITGITDIEINRPLIVVNNPFSEVLQTRLHSYLRGDMKINIFDITGKVLDERNLCMSAGDEITLTWNTELWKNGLYLILLKDQKGDIKVLKVVRSNNDL